MQTPAPFAYARADTSTHALALLQHVPESRILAGGHSLLPMMKLRLARPECLIDIDDVYELDYVVEDGDELRDRRADPARELLAVDARRRLFPIIADAERVIADPIVRNRGTIGGSLCQADPAEDLSDASASSSTRSWSSAAPGRRARGARPGVRTGPVRDGRRRTTSSSPRSASRCGPASGSAYQKVERRVGDWAVAAAGAAGRAGRRTTDRRRRRSG